MKELPFTFASSDLSSFTSSSLQVSLCSIPDFRCLLNINFTRGISRTCIYAIQCIINFSGTPQRFEKIMNSYYISHWV